MTILACYSCNLKIFGVLNATFFIISSNIGGTPSTPSSTGSECARDLGMDFHSFLCKFFYFLSLSTRLRDLVNLVHAVKLNMTSFSAVKKVNKVGKFCI